MKIRVSFKNPDGLEDAILNAVDDIEDHELRIEKIEELQVLCSKWFKYQEYLYVEIDTETETCTVLEIGG